MPGFGQTFSIEYLDYNRLAGEKNTSVLVNVGHQILSSSCVSRLGDREMLKGFPKAKILSDIPKMLCRLYCHTLHALDLIS